MSEEKELMELKKDLVEDIAADLERLIYLFMELERVREVTDE